MVISRPTIDHADRQLDVAAVPSCPLARPHSALLIRIQKEHGENASGFYEFLEEVSGGRDHRPSMLKCSRGISAQVAALKGPEDAEGIFER